MLDVWTRGLSGEEKDKRKQTVLNYRNAFDDLREVLEKEYEKATPDYDTPSWAYKQAHVNGHNQAIKRVLELINLKE